MKFFTTLIHRPCLLLRLDALLCHTLIRQPLKDLPFIFPWLGKKYKRINEGLPMLRNIILSLCTAALAASTRAQEPAGRELVYVIPIKEMIEPALLYVVRRGMDEAVRNDAAAIIFEINTPGGVVGAAEDIVDSITRTDIPVYSFVEKQALSAGGLIALATPRIYMAPGSVIGAITPMMMTPMGGVQELPDEVEEKMTSAVAAMVRSAAEQGGHDPLMAEAMVRANIEYKVNGKVISEKGRLLTLTNVEAAQLVGEEQRPLLSSGTVDDLDALLEVLGLAGAEKRTLEITAAERIARWIARMASILMIIGLGGLWLEFKTPGFGFFGIAGIICLLLFFFGHHIAGLAGFEDVLIFLLGVALLAVEIFITPGFGIMGISGLLLIFASFISALSERMPGSWRPVDFSLETFSIPLLKVTLAFTGSILLVAICGRFLPRTRVFQSLTLDEVVPDDVTEQNLLGLEGIAHSDLRPSGTAYFGTRKIDVVTFGDYIPRQTPVRIVEVHGNRIVVENITRS
jgi:membrane-bound serine protease (ClpP class)